MSLKKQYTLKSVSEITFKFEKDGFLVVILFGSPTFATLRFPISTALSF
jgi:hypothetical protein